MAEIPFPTTWDVWNPTNNGIFTISTGAGFQPSTVTHTKHRPKENNNWRPSQTIPILCKPYCSPAWSVFCLGDTTLRKAECPNPPSSPNFFLEVMSWIQCRLRKHFFLIPHCSLTFHKKYQKLRSQRNCWSCFLGVTASHKNGATQHRQNSEVSSFLVHVDSSYIEKTRSYKYVYATITY